MHIPEIGEGGRNRSTSTIQRNLKFRQFKTGWFSRVQWKIEMLNNKSPMTAIAFGHFSLEPLNLESSLNVGC